MLEGMIIWASACVLRDPDMNSTSDPIADWYSAVRGGGHRVLRDSQGASGGDPRRAAAACRHLRRWDAVLLLRPVRVIPPGAGSYTPPGEPQALFVTDSEGMLSCHPHALCGFPCPEAFLLQPGRNW